MQGPTLGTAKSLHVRVPGSTSNLGTGFDALGLALALFVEVRAERRSAGTGTPTSVHSGERAGFASEWPEGPDELLARAFRRSAGAAAGEWVLHANSELPTARGFGSSGAAVTAGLLLGCAAANSDPDRDELLRMAVELEGHPDNVAPSLFGGCTLAVPDGDRTHLVRPHIDPSLRFVIAWPARPLATARARAVLPETVPHADAVENARRFALLLAGLDQGRAAWIRAGMRDTLHVPYRLELVPGAAHALKAAVEAGALAATLSGSGSGLFAIATSSCTDAVAAAMRDAFTGATGTGEARVVDVVTEAPVVRTAD